MNETNHDRPATNETKAASPAAGTATKSPENVASETETPDTLRHRHRRIEFLDELRGGLILLMVLHHFCYTVGYLFDVSWGRAIFTGIGILQPIGAGLFIAICGLCCHLSRSNWRRGGLLAGAAAALSLVMWVFMRDEMIWFGILHFLAVCILLYAAARPLLDRVPLWIGGIACAVLGLLCWHLPVGSGGFFGIPGLWEAAVPAAWQAQGWLYPLGLGRGVSADYFPLLPWVFVFLFGTFLGRPVAEGKVPPWMYRSHARWLGAVGRHTLWIYLAHQPVIYGLCWLWFSAVS